MKKSELFQTCLNISTKTPHTAYLVSKHGEGKTSFIQTNAEKLGLSCITLNISTIEPQDFCGLPYRDENNVTRYAKPYFLDYDVLFLDEIDRPRDAGIRAALLSLLNDKSINGHALKKGAVIISAGNGTQSIAAKLKIKGDYETSEFDLALDDRLVPIKFEYSIDEKIEYLQNKHGTENVFVKYVAAKREVFTEFSSRRIDGFASLGGPIDLAASYFDEATARQYVHFIQENLVTLEHIKLGQYELENIGPVSRQALINDIVGGFFDLSELDGLANLNKFINALRPEEKAAYFKKLYEVGQKNASAFPEKCRELNGLGFFKGQKTHLQALLG